jgi:hypothetical protein
MSVEGFPGKVSLSLKRDAGMKTLYSSAHTTLIASTCHHKATILRVRL